MITIDEESRTVTTTFPDGTSVVARPVYDDESVARAASLGYVDEDPVWEMTRDHDPLHVLVADAMTDGRGCSASLFLASYPELVTDAIRKRASREERVVLLIQRLMNEGVEPLLAELAAVE